MPSEQTIRRIVNDVFTLAHKAVMALPAPEALSHAMRLQTLADSLVENVVSQLPSPPDGIPLGDVTVVGIYLSNVLTDEAAVVCSECGCSDCECVEGSYDEDLEEIVETTSHTCGVDCDVELDEIEFDEDPDFTVLRIGGRYYKIP